MRRIAPWLGCCAVLLAASASAGDDPVELRPPWDFGSYRRIAVIPVQVAPEPRVDPHADEIAVAAWYALEDYLRRAPEFTVAPRSDAEQLAASRDFSSLNAQSTVGSGALAASGSSPVDALVVGVIDHIRTDTQSQTITRTRFAKESGGIKRDDVGRPIAIGPESFTLIRHIGAVGGAVYVIDARSGKVLLQHLTAPIVFDAEQREHAPAAPALELAKLAAAELGLDFSRRIAPQRFAAKIGSDSLVVALEYYDDTYDESKKIYPVLDEFVVAVRSLPLECEQIPFKLGIGPEDQDDIWSVDFVWSRNRPARGVMFRVPTSLLAATGEDEFELRLYGPGEGEPLEDRGFDLRPP